MPQCNTNVAVPESVLFLSILKQLDQVYKDEAHSKTLEICESIQLHLCFNEFTCDSTASLRETLNIS